MCVCLIKSKTKKYHVYMIIYNNDIHHCIYIFASLHYPI